MHIIQHICGIGAIVGLFISTGCANGPTKAIDVAAIAASPKTEVKFDVRLLLDCEPLLKAKSSREEDLKVWADDTIKKHTSCATMKAEENREVRKAFNIKPSP